jgi:hypothetical protein
MGFESSDNESRSRFSEASALLNFLRQTAPPDFTPLDDIQKAYRGLWLVSMYGAVERSVNAIVESAIQVVSSHGSRSIDCVPSLHSIFHYSKIQSVQSCGRGKVFDSSVSLFEASLSSAAMIGSDNTLSESLQNVDASTMRWVAKLFGTSPLIIDGPVAGRLSTLRERRNAIAHGRESASEVGERYTVEEMQKVYEASDAAVTAFSLSMKDHCDNKKYLKLSA